MPPLRTNVPIKPIKTERSHEENQERAYIAASRRSDRSLEARVESARRASEIHKRRTGRSLRVTEQDVLNEEMYEEEDDDLPSQYRRLTAHLQTGSADFNRRLAAYLTNHVAMRSALDQAITASFAQQFPGAPQFAHNQIGAFPSPFPDQAAAAATSPGPMSPTSPHPYRHAPYPMRGMPNYRGQAHQPRAASISNEQEFIGPLNQPGKGSPQPAGPSVRRSSMPAPKPTPSQLKQHVEARPSTSTEEQVPDSNLPQNSYDAPLPFTFSPFTTSLPPDTQQLLGPALDPSDPFTSALMSGSDVVLPKYETNFYSYVPKDFSTEPTTGIGSTLAPTFKSSQDVPPSVKNEPAADPDVSTFSQAFDDLQDDSFLTMMNEAGNDRATPNADGAWDAFIDDSTWAEGAA